MPNVKSSETLIFTNKNERDTYSSLSSGGREHHIYEKIGIYKYNTEEEAINKINSYYVRLAEGKSRPITEFKEVPIGYTFKEFNDYINSLDENIKD